MILLVSLGNPGKKYKETRHNVGFLVADKFKEINNFPEFKLSKKSNSLISEKENIVLIKPQVFMNNSGLAVKKLIHNSKFKIQNLIVVHDDIDLLLGKIKIVKERGSAGHKGIESIIKEIGTKNFIRFRIGIKRKNLKPKNVEKFVLQKFSKEEKEVIKKVVKKTIEAIETTIDKGLEKAMSEYNK